MNPIFQNMKSALDHARVQLEETGKCRLYSHSDLQQFDTSPAVYARLVETTYVHDEHAIFPSLHNVNPEKVASSESFTRGWVYDPRQLESGDQEPRVLCAALGTHYNPNAEYELQLIMPPESMQIERADKEGIAKLGDTYLSGSEDDYKKALSAEKQPEYKQFIETERTKREASQELPLNLSDKGERSYFSEHYGQQSEHLTTSDLNHRTELHGSLGANEFYSTLGMTKTNPNVIGVDVGQHNMLTSKEYIIVDNKPHCVGELKEAGLVVSLPCNEIKRDIQLTNPDREAFDKAQATWNENKDVELKLNNISTNEEFLTTLESVDKENVLLLSEKYKQQLNEINATIKNEDMYSAELANKENCVKELESRISEIDAHYPQNQQSEKNEKDNQQAIEARESEGKEESEQQAIDSTENQAKEKSEQQAIESTESQSKEVSEQQAVEVTKNQAKEVSEQQAVEVTENKAKETSEQQTIEATESQNKETPEQQAVDSTENHKTERDMIETSEKQNMNTPEYQSKNDLENKAETVIDEQSSDKKESSLNEQPQKLESSETESASSDSNGNRWSQMMEENTSSEPSQEQEREMN